MTILFDARTVLTGHIVRVYICIIMYNLYMKKPPFAPDQQCWFHTADETIAGSVCGQYIRIRVCPVLGNIQNNNRGSREDNILSQLNVNKNANTD